MSENNSNVKIVHQGQVTALDRLHSYSITGSSEAMRQQMLDDTFALQDVAILGQWTTLYAAPNTGKTLLTLWLLREALRQHNLDGDDVFYVNADDNYRGIVEKTELAEQWGFHMVAPNQNGFNSTEITQLMIELSETGEAKGVVIILDTLKKFTDLMHKKEATQFGIISRGFVAAGGTLICLAHTNKHKSADGKSIYSGTSDVRDDSDCVFIIDKVEGRLFEDEIAVEFVNDKARGDVADSVSFSYAKRHGQTYTELIESVQRLEGDKLAEMKSSAAIAKKLEEDQEAIAAICKAITSGVTSKSAIVKNVGDETGISHKMIRRILAEREGSMYSLGHRWQVEVGKHNKSTYSVLAETKSA